MLLLLDAKDALPANLPLKVASRAGSDLDGNWMTNFNPIRTDAAPFNAVALRRLLGFESACVVPRHVIQGAPAENRDDVLSGIFYGWLNNLAVRVRISKEGKDLLTTFRFDEYGADPYATCLIDSMIESASDSAFAPKFAMMQETKQRIQWL